MKPLLDSRAALSELERLEHALRIALRMAPALGQDAEMLWWVEAQASHPAIGVFGL